MNVGQVGSSTTSEADSSQLKPVKLDSFMINGKIGITVPATETRAAQGGSAFYAWGQQNDRFAIEIIGALGLGKTNIEFNGSTATLVSEKTGTLSASSPDELLKKATGWQ
ncbi:MAG: lipoprotein insertase outer membrane protein LolB, partial [Psychrobacter sp.]|nr:lipoprotein insertase outer membrane protein LolB [Psychrobacter sp.]